MSDEAVQHDAVLTTYVDNWWQAIADFLEVVDQLDESDGTTTTDLPGWDVHAVVAHVAHLEHVSIGGAHDEVEGIEIGAPAHVGSMMGVFTEQGVVGRQHVPITELVTSIRRDTEVRNAQLRAAIPDPATPADGVFGAIGWTWRTLLRNRPLDVWMHEQDIRRAIGLPGGMDSAGAQHTADYLSEAFGYVVGKKVAPPAGTTAVLEVTGSAVQAIVIGEDGRGRPMAEVPAEPTVRLSMDREPFILLAGGRRLVEEGAVKIEGDQDLGARIVAKLASTP